MQTFSKYVAFGIGLVSILMLAATSLMAIANYNTLLSSTGGAFGQVVIIFMINGLVSVVVALLILSRKPGHVLGWLLLAVGFLFSWWEISHILGFFINTPGFPVLVRSFLRIGRLVYLFPLILPMGLIPLLFPDGQLASKRWRPVLACSIIGILGVTLGQVYEDIRDEAVSESILIALQIFQALLILGIIGGIISMVVRFRRSKGDERAQFKWVVYTAGVSLSIMLLMIIFLGEDNSFLGTYSSGIPGYMTIGIGIAILRYRLFDIDIIIRRTLQYAILTTTLVLIYFGGVLLLQRVVEGLFGEGNSPLITVLTTLGVAALFNPLRNRTQEFIDRRFFRRKYDVEQALNNFSALTRDQVDLKRLSGLLLTVVEETMQPENTSLWIRGQMKDT